MGGALDKRGPLVERSVSARRASIALVLLVAVMPNRGGHEVALEVRALRPDVGIILSTGYSDALAEGPAASEIDEVLPKP